MQRTWKSSLWVMLIVIVLTGCGSSDDTSAGTSSENNTSQNESSDEGSSNSTDTENSETSKDSKDKTEESETSEGSSDDKDVYEASGDNDEEHPSTGNMLDKEKVIKYKDGSILITINNAELTTFFESSNADPENSFSNREITNDSEVFFHLTGTIKNDTSDSFSFGHKLAPVGFTLTYDDEHEFDMTGTTEEKDGSEFKGTSSVDALTTGKIHVYAKVPKPVSETDKPLVLHVRVEEETIDIPIR